LDERYPGMRSAVLAVHAGRRLRPLATSAGAVRSTAVPLSSRTTVGHAVLDDVPVAANQTDDAMPYADRLFDEGVARAVLACPVPGSEGVWGALAVFSPDEHVWTPDEVAFAEAVCAVLGAAVRRSELEEKLEHQALHDVLTGLPNRALAADRMELALSRARRHQTRIAVLLLDLDDFKGVNDSLGHAVGDQLLGELSHRLQAVLPGGDTVARLGGDEFVVICEDVTGPEEATALADRLLAACAEPFTLGAAPREITTSIGITLADGDGDVQTLLAEADIAMYRAKRDHPGSHRVFDKTMRAEVLDKVNLSTELRAAVGEGALEVWYQPIVETVSRKVVALEALARWRDRSGVMVPPHAFIPLAEETGIIIDLGRTVLEQAVAAASRWRETRPDVALRVNASAHELRDPLFADRVDAIRAAGNLPAGHLGLEITESVLVDEGKHSQGNLQRIKELGIGLLLDDFGTGYSSLSYLQRFPDIDVLKIDRTFLQDEVRGAAILAALIDLGRAFGFSLCAEGVETVEQRDLLVELGCDLAQGFLFAKPVPESELAGLLDRLTD
ncbi:MAG: EAL domain-containing protein, partial [Nocardioides sp.]